MKAIEAMPIDCARYPTTQMAARLDNPNTQILIVHAPVAECDFIIAADLIEECLAYHTDILLPTDGRLIHLLVSQKVGCAALAE